MGLGLKWAVFVLLVHWGRGRNIGVSRAIVSVFNVTVIVLRLLCPSVVG